MAFSSSIRIELSDRRLRYGAGRAAPARAGALLLFLLAAPAAVQASPCKTLLAAAQDHYVDQRFDEAEVAIRTCLGRPYLAPKDALASYRLLALLYLRQGDLAEAKHAVIQLLSVSFDYEPDPVLDPPTYNALVETVRNQLRVEVDAEGLRLASAGRTRVQELSPVGAPSVAGTESGAPARSQALLRSIRSVHLGLAVGSGSYSGERGINAPTLLGEFSENGGVSFALDGTYYVTSTLAVAVQLHTARFPVLLTNDVRPEDVQVRPSDSSEWVHALTVLGRALYRPEWRAAPYVQFGVSGILGRLNNEARVAVGPQAGLGVDVAATPRLTGFAEFNVVVAIPGDAVDGVNIEGGLGDLFTLAGVGVRYRLGTP